MESPRKISFSSIQVSLLIFPILFFRFAPIGLNAVKTSLRQRLAPEYASIAKAKCTHVVGDYYRVWDTVFYSRILCGPKLWGITYRGKVIEDLWNLKKFKHPRVCYWLNDKKKLNHYSKNLKSITWYL